MVHGIPYKKKKKKRKKERPTVVTTQSVCKCRVKENDFVPSTREKRVLD